MPEQDERLNRAIEVLKEPVEIDSTLDRRVMAAVAATAPPRRWRRQVWTGIDWMRRGRPVTVSPLGGLAMAAGLALLFVIGRGWIAPESGSQTSLAVAEERPSVVQFVIVAPAASSVSLVGDFNDWRVAATPLRRVEGNGVWSVTVPLDAGRYRYAFLVDETTWLSDPSAPPALDDEFGRPGSVITVGEL